MKARIKFRKLGVMKFIGHLDVMRYFQKAIRRAGLPIAFTEGYSPHMIMSFASPLGVGMTSDGEYFDIELREPISGVEAIRRLNEQMVEGMEVIGFVRIPEDKKNKGMTLVAGAEYLSRACRGTLPQDWKERLDAFYIQKEIKTVKRTKREEKEVDIRPMIHKLTAREDSIYMQVDAGSARNLKPDSVTDAFAEYCGVKDISFAHHRLETFANTGSEENPVFVPLDALGTEFE
ncbi:MAG: DUF2344 domain-containing protein [Coprococcus sp.]|nr:DUF2344 domain-containing protein [Coprococcus sp.]